MNKDLQNIFDTNKIMVIDGSMSTALEQRGADLNDELWTARVLAEQPELIKDVHKAYFRAGADCGITASYQATIPGLMKKGYSRQEAESILARSVQLFREARLEWWAEEHQGAAAGDADTPDTVGTPAAPAHTDHSGPAVQSDHSGPADQGRDSASSGAPQRPWPLCLAAVGPYGAYLADGSEYKGNYKISDEELRDFHRRRMEILWKGTAETENGGADGIDADTTVGNTAETENGAIDRTVATDKTGADGKTGADLLLIETIPSLREALVCADLAEELGADYWISFSCMDGQHICEGTPIAECARELSREHPHLQMLGVNCTDPRYIASLITELKRCTDLPVAVYPNSGDRYDPNTKTWKKAGAGMAFGAYAFSYMEAGARAVGGCCTTVESHIREVAKARQRFLAGADSAAEAHAGAVGSETSNAPGAPAPILAAYMVPHPPMIVPAVGRGSEQQVTETTRAYQQVAEEIAELAPDTIIITSPHSVMYADYFHISPGASASGSFEGFGAPEVSFQENYDTELVDAICELADGKGFPAGTLGQRPQDIPLDHGTMVPLYFIRQKYQGGSIVRLGLSGLPLTEHYALGEIIRQAAADLGRRVVFVASGDLSHKLQDYGPYGFAPEGPEYDRRIMDVCSRAAFGELFRFDEAFCDKAAECGHRSFVIMAGALDGVPVRAKQLCHQDITGVGYGICTFHPEHAPDPDRHFRQQYIEELEAEIARRADAADGFVRLARNAVEAYILRGETLRLPDDLPEEMRSTRAGAFVSIHKDGALRGCIGTIAPTEDCVAREIITNAINASTQDPRFPAIRPEELSRLDISVDVLGEAEAIPSQDYLDVKRYGVIVTSGGKRGLLLPDLDGVDSVSQQVAIACRKAGIRDGEPVQLQRFEVIRHH